MDRRGFLKVGGLSAVASSMLLGGCGDEPAPDDPNAGFPDPGPIPSSARTASRQELDLTLNVLEGALPRDLSGHALFVAPAAYPDDANVLTGDGMVFRIDFGRDEVKLVSRLMKTPDYYADLATLDTELGFSGRSVARISPKLGFRNALNTALVPTDHGLLVTFDAGRPYVLDPRTLELVTPVGRTSEWREQVPEDFFPGPFRLYGASAHPAYDARTKELFTINFAYLPSVFTDLMRWDGKTLDKFALVAEDGEPVRIDQSVHMLGLTQRYVLLADTLIAPDPGIFVNGTGSSVGPRPDTRLYLVKRADLKAGVKRVTAKKVVLPRELDHFLCDYDDADGIVFHSGMGGGRDSSEGLFADDVQASTGEPVRRDLVGMLTAATDIGVMARYVIEPERGAILDERIFEEDPHTWGIILYTFRGSLTPDRLRHAFWSTRGQADELVTERVRELFVAYPHRKVDLDTSVRVRRAPQLLHFDHEKLTLVDSYTFPPGRFVSSPQFVPRRDTNDDAITDGYLIVNVISDQASAHSSGDELWLFDAQDVAKGPVAKLGHPDIDLSFTLHTTWLPSLEAPPSDYVIDVRKDYADAIAKAPEDVKRVFEEDVFPHFDGEGSHG